jgi:hypothetical protein
VATLLYEGEVYMSNKVNLNATPRAEMELLMSDKECTLLDKITNEDIIMT